MPTEMVVRLVTVAKG